MTAIQTNSVYIGETEPGLALLSLDTTYLRYSLSAPKVKLSSVACEKSSKSEVSGMLSTSFLMTVLLDWSPYVIPDTIVRQISTVWYLKYLIPTWTYQ